MRIWLDISAIHNHTGHPTGCIRAELELFYAIQQKSSWGLLIYIESTDLIYSFKNTDFSHPIINIESFATRFSKENLEKDKRTEWNPSEGDVILTVGVHAADKFMSRIRSYATLYRCKIATYVHDLIPIHYPQFSNIEAAAERFSKFISDVCLYSDIVMVNSETTRNDLQKFNKDVQPVTVFLGENSFKSISLEKRNSINSIDMLTDDFVLYVSTIEPRKNHEILVRAYRFAKLVGRLHEMPTLVLIGRMGWGHHNWLTWISSDLELSGKIKIFTNVSDEELHDAYHKTKAILFPSFYEGWGLSVSEAKTFSKPAIISNNSALSEHEGSHLVKIDPSDFLAWYECILNFHNLPVPSQIQQIRSWSEFCEEIFQKITDI